MNTKTREFLKEFWSLIPTIILGILFYFLISYRLIIGGILFLFLGIIYMLRARKDKKSFYYAGISLFLLYMGIISLLAKFLLPKGVDSFVFVVIFAFFCLLFFYNIILSHLGKVAKFFSFFILIFLGIITIISINSTLTYINSNGFANIYFYLGFVIFISFSTIIYFTLFRLIFEVIKKGYNYPLFNNYFYLGLSIMLLILINGFYYISNFSNDKLRDFLIILSLAFVTSFAGSSAIKSLESQNAK